MARKESDTLSYAFENDDCTKVMLPVKRPLGLKQLRQPNSISTGNVRAKTVMSSFKASTLNATLKFVKDDSRLVLQYPHMSTEQAQFIKQMITQCMGPLEEMDTGPGSKGLFDPLAEAFKIFSLKYDFKLNDAIPFSLDMKRLVLEKIPKQSKKKKGLDLNTSLSSTSSESDQKLLQITPLIENVSEEFSNKTFIQIKNFITDDTDCLTFEDLTVKQEQFLMQWKCYLKPDIRKWFSEEVQEILLEIEKLIRLAQGRFKLRTIMEKICGTRRNVYLKKKWGNSNVTLLPENKDHKPTLHNAPAEKVFTELNNNLTISMANMKLRTLQNGTLTLNEPIEKVITVNNPMGKVIKNTALPIAKVNTENIEVNKTTHVKSMPITKVNTKGELNKISKVAIEKVITESTNENENTLNRIKENESSVEVNNNTIGTSDEMRMKNSVLVNSEDFISTRGRTDLSTNKSKNKLSTLLDAINRISSTFARLALQSLKDFISNPDKDTASFKNLKWEELEFLLRWTDVIRRVEVVKLFSVEGQMVLDELRSLVDRCSAKFVVVVAMKTVSPINRTVTFMKQYTKKKQSYPVLNTPIHAETKETTQCTEEISNASSDDDNSNVTDEKIERFLNKIFKIKVIWMRTTLSELLDFLKDDTQNRYAISNVTKAEKAFLVNWKDKLSKSEVRIVLPEQIRILLDEIYYCVSKNALEFSVSFEITKLANSKRRNFSFIKVPCNATPKRKEKIKKTVESITIPVRLPPKIISDKTLDTTTTRRLQEMEQLVRENVPTDDKKKDEIAVADDPHKSNASETGISKTSGATSLVKVQVQDKRSKSANNNPKARIIEALNQPVVSERGLKMMKIMGWEGGALGVRGEGIVEPITLNLDGKKRAGLGCPKPPPKVKPTKAEPTLPSNITRVNLPPSKYDVKTTIMETIEDMIVSLEEDHLEMQLVSQGLISGKTWKFVKNLVTILNRREDFLNWSEFCNVHDILDLIADTEYIVTACLGTSGKNILLVLSKTCYKPTSSDSKYWSSIIGLDTYNCPRKPKIDLPTDLNLGKLSDGLAFRFYAINVIWEFCKEPTDKFPPHGRIVQDTQLNNSMAAKQMSYIRDTIIRLNNKSRSSSCNEQKIFEEILTQMMGYTLDVEFPITEIKVCNISRPPLFKCIRLYKVFDTHNTTSSTTHGSNTETASKICVRSNDSNNKLLLKNNSETDNNAQNSKNNINTRKRRTTFTKDTFDEKDMFDNQDYLDASQYVPMNSQMRGDSENVPVDWENIPVNKDVPVDWEDIPVNSDDVPVDWEDIPVNSDDVPVDWEDIPVNSDDVPVDSENAYSNNVKIRTTFTNDTFDEKFMFDNQDSLDVSQNVPIYIQNIVVDAENVPIKSENIPVDSLQVQKEIKTAVGSQKAPTDNLNPIDSQNEPNISKNISILTQNATIGGQNATIGSQNASIHSQNVSIVGQNASIGSQNATIGGQNATIGSQNASIHSQNVSIVGQNASIGGQNACIGSQNVFTDSTSTPVLNNDHINNLEYEEDINKTLLELKVECEEDLKKELSELKAECEEDSKKTSELKEECVEDLTKTLELNEECEEGLTKTSELNEECEEDLTKISGLKEECVEDLTKTFSELKECLLRQVVEKQDVAIKDNGKRSMSNPLTPIRKFKKLKEGISVKKISITPKDYPQNKMTNKMAAEIQKSILDSIDYTEELPLLECHGIQDGALIYTCNTKKSFNLIESLTSAFQVNIIENKVKPNHKMIVKINNYIDESTDSIFDRLELYNMSLHTKNWKVLKTEKTLDSIVMHLVINDYSYQLIVKENFALYAGTDLAKFSAVWD